MLPAYKLLTRKFILPAFLVPFILLLLFVPSCSKKNVGWKSVDPAYAKYVDAYSTGIVSKTAPIRIQLASNAATTHTVGEEVKEKLFTLTPAVKGKTVWVDARTIEFRPEKNLEPDKLYEVNFKLGKVTQVPEKFRELVFNFQTIQPAFKVTQDGLRSDGTKDKMFLEGSIATADAEEATVVERLLTGTQNGTGYKIQWQHSNAGKSHRFTINNIKRAGTSQQLLLKWTGVPLKITNSGGQTLAVPAIGDFKVLATAAINDAQQYASVQFSDPVAIDQDLTGLLSLSNQPQVSYSINGSEVKLFASGQLDGNFTVNSNAGIKNKWGQSLSANFVANVVFENRKPSVRIHGKGNILPTSGRLVLPFDAVNLAAVDISILKIYENNIPQFFQENNIGGNNELRRVARPIVQKTLRLDDDKTLDLHIKQRFSLDIDKFIKTEPGAIYSITIGFRPQYSLYSKTAVDTGQVQSEGREEEEYYDEGYYTRQTNY